MLAKTSKNIQVVYPNRANEKAKLAIRIGLLSFPCADFFAFATKASKTIPATTGKPTSCIEIQSVPASNNQATPQTSMKIANIPTDTMRM